MTKQDVKSFLVEEFASRLVFTMSRHWTAMREYEQNDMKFWDFIHDDGWQCSVVQIGNELFATED